MSGPSASASAPILVLLLVVATDLWVYADAKAQRERGTPVVLSAGSLNVDTPVAWFVGCLLLWILFFPLYMASRAKRARRVVLLISTRCTSAPLADRNDAWAPTTPDTPELAEQPRQRLPGRGFLIRVAISVC